MLGFGPLLVLLVAGLAWLLTLRPSRSARPSRLLPPPPRPAALEQLDTWVAAGLLTQDQADAISSFEAARTRLAPAPARGEPRARRAGRVPVFAEALGYLGGVLAIVGLVLVVAHYWIDMATWARVALSGIAALALVTGGVLVREDADPALARLRWVLWLGATASGALLAGVVADDVLGAESRKVVTLAGAGAVALVSAALWQGRERPVQQLTCLAGTIVFGALLAGQFADGGPIGVTVWLLAAILLLLGLRRRTPLALLTEAVGAAALVAAGLIVPTEWQAFGLLLASATACALLAVAAVTAVPTQRPDRRIAAVAGTVAFLESVPGTLGYFAERAGAATGLATWAAGAIVLYVGARGLVRGPLVVQVTGAAGLIGGAALTGVQWPVTAPAFGIATAVGLVALGTRPGQVLLSLFGAAGLLVNVPWAIGRWFPGERSAPLLVFVSGLVILAVAVLLARAGGRLRSELRPPRRGRHGPPRATPGTA